MVKARKQIVKPVGPQKSDCKPKQDYNIWYNKYSGSRHKPGEERSKATTRCHLSTDAGETRGCHRDDAGICLNFARGCCPLGYDCSWKHDIPKGDSEGTMKDCFGRERHENVRDDQSGVGSFMADDETSRTLYIGGIIRSPDMQAVVYKHFSEWGDIQNVRILDNKGVAFVRYKTRANAEFAMEAMQRQSLDNDEVLNIRWATEDPNPWAQKRKEVSAKRKLLDAAVESGNIDPDLPSKRKPPKDISEATGYYPNTDHFYVQGGMPVEYNTPPSPPKTLSDLVAWSRKQAADQSKETDASNSTNEAREEAKNIQSLVCDYGSSSDEED